MDGREGTPMSGSAGYYLHRGFGDSGPGFGSASGGGSGTPSGFAVLPGFKHFSSPNNSFQSIVRENPLGSSSTFHVDNNPLPNFPSVAPVSASSGGSSSNPVRKKRGRPRKYGPDATNMSLELSPMSSKPSLESTTSPKRSRGRPRGSGWKQNLSPLGEWMNSTAGMGFTPHIVHIRVGEDIAMKILSFAQQRSRALCVLSANGAVSAVTLHQSSSGSVTYEGHFDILCLSGSYLVGESEGPANRTGGLSVSVCSPDGNIFGGAIAGKLTASSPVQVIVCTFVYCGQKTKDHAESSSKVNANAVVPHAEQSSAPTNAAPVQYLTPNSPMGSWLPGPQQNQRNPHVEIDLTSG